MYFNLITGIKKVVTYLDNYLPTIFIKSNQLTIIIEIQTRNKSKPRQYLTVPCYLENIHFRPTSIFLLSTKLPTSSEIYLGTFLEGHSSYLRYDEAYHKKGRIPRLATFSIPHQIFIIQRNLSRHIRNGCSQNKKRFRFENRVGSGDIIVFVSCDKREKVFGRTERHL